jgi:hypothetical protein
MLENRHCCVLIPTGEQVAFGMTVFATCSITMLSETFGHALQPILEHLVLVTCGIVGCSLYCNHWEPSFLSWSKIFMKISFFEGINLDASAEVAL